MYLGGSNGDLPSKAELGARIGRKEKLVTVRSLVYYIIRLAVANVGLVIIVVSQPAT